MEILLILTDRDKYQNYTNYAVYSLAKICIRFPCTHHHTLQRTQHAAEIWDDGLQLRLAGWPRSIGHVVAVVMFQYFFDLFAPLQRIAFLVFKVVRSIRLDAHTNTANPAKHCNLHK